jgi:DNA-binding NarL/FixJ family response regulator
MDSYSVVIVENHTLFSQALSSVINSFKKFNVSYTCSNQKELIDKLKFSSTLPNLVLIDFNMPVSTEVNITLYIREQYPSISVIALSDEKNETTIINMLQSGIKSYLFKEIETKTLETALTEVMIYGYYHTSSVSNILVNSFTKTVGIKKAVLNEQEKKFLKFICSELTYKQIAKKMCRSPKTIDGYRDCLFEKLKIRSRTGLVLYAIKNKIHKP